jgi:hypothetical protein
MRTKPEWGRSVLSLVSLSGSLLMLSDPIDAYDDARVRTIQRCLPPLSTFTAETGPLDLSYQAYAWTKLHGVDFTGAIEYDWKEVNDEDAVIISGDHETMEDDHPLASLWAFHFSTAAGKWCVILRIANLPMRGSTVAMEKLGLDPDKEYAAFDFWSEKYLGMQKGSIELGSLELGFSQVIGFWEVLECPRLIGNTRHVSMGAVSVKEHTWHGDVLRAILAGVPDTHETYWLHTPAGWELLSADAEGAQVTVEPNGGAETTAFRIHFVTAEVAVSLRWRTPSGRSGNRRGNRRDESKEASRESAGQEA